MSVETATHYRTATLVPLFQKMLERCKVHKDETVLVVTDPDSSQEYAAAMFAAARSFGADVMTLVLPPAPPEQASFIRTGNISSTIVANSKKALEFLKMADFVIDMTSIGLLHTKEQVAVLESGTRMLERLFPEDADKVRVKKHAERMRKAKRIRLESDNGTDAWFDMDGQPVIEQWGWTDEPGRWDHWPGAFQYTSPTEGLGEGVIVTRPTFAGTDGAAGAKVEDVAFLTVATIGEVEEKKPLRLMPIVAATRITAAAIIFHGIGRPGVDPPTGS